jgi:Mlc titration factor MtfA (ptsG expression regulator)
MRKTIITDKNLKRMFGLKNWRRKRIAARPFPDKWLAIIHKNVPFYKRLPPADRKELLQHILILTTEKYFEGCSGLQITAEIKVTIAAFACLLLLHRKTDYYPGLRTILVYPQAYVVRRSRYLPGGIIAEGADIRIGESWHTGTVVLSWDDVQSKAGDIHDGHNVVFHEFAHQLDSSGAKLDSTPILQSHSTYIAWARVLQKEYQRLCSAVTANHSTLLDKYGAKNPAEFFAVATECFFEKPLELRSLYPELYEELKRFYQQDPALLFGHADK